MLVEDLLCNRILPELMKKRYGKMADCEQCISCVQEVLDLMRTLYERKGTCNCEANIPADGKQTTDVCGTERDTGDYRLDFTRPHNTTEPVPKREKQDDVFEALERSRRGFTCDKCGGPCHCEGWY